MYQTKNTKLRRELPKLIEMLNNGEPIEVLHYNRPVAYLICPEDFMLLKVLKEENEVLTQE